MRKPWQEIEPGITQADIEQHAAVFGVAERDVQTYVTEYIRVFRQGPGMFVPWYLRIWNAGGVGGIDPFYPHEVFPVLMSMDADWLYEHPAWTGRRVKTAPLRPLVE